MASVLLYTTADIRIAHNDSVVTLVEIAFHIRPDLPSSRKKYFSCLRSLTNKSEATHPPDEKLKKKKKLRKVKPYSARINIDLADFQRNVKKNGRHTYLSMATGGAWGLLSTGTQYKQESIVSTSHWSLLRPRTSLVEPHPKLNRRRRS